MAPHFDPWKSNLEEALIEQERFADQIDPEGPIYQWCAAQEIKALEKAGLKSGFDVLAAVAVCAQHGLAMPDWLARSYLKRYRAVQQLHVASWDDEGAFGRPYPRGAQVGAMRRRRLNRVKVANAVTEFVQGNPDSPLEPEWPRIGALVSKSDKEAQKLYSEALRMGPFVKPEILRARRMEKRPPRKLPKFRG